MKTKTRGIVNEVILKIIRAATVTESRKAMDPSHPQIATTKKDDL